MIAPVVSLKGRDFIDLADLDRRQLRQILDLAHEIKAGKWSKRPLQGRHIAMLFQKPSHRTRVSFEVGIARLGGATTTLTENDVQLGVRETISDAAQVLDRYVDGVVARLRSHDDLVALARASEKPPGGWTLGGGGTGQEPRGGALPPHPGPPGGDGPPPGRLFHALPAGARRGGGHRGGHRRRARGLLPASQKPPLRADGPDGGN